MEMQENKAKKLKVPRIDQKRSVGCCEVSRLHSSEDDDLETAAPPSPPRSPDRSASTTSSRSRSAASPCTPSRSPSPSPWDESGPLQLTPNGRRKAPSFGEDMDTPDDLPSDLRYALGTPKEGSSESRERYRSESPMSFYADEADVRRLREGTEEDEDGPFKRHHPGQSSEYSIHSAPADLDTSLPEKRMQSESVDSPSGLTNPPLPRIYDRRRASGAFRLPFSLYEYLQEEIMAGEQDEEEGAKSERVTNFLTVPGEVEKIADRLCCSFGQDLQDSLFSRQTFGRRHDGSRPHIRPVALFALNTAYVVAHTLVLFYQLVTLNVAVNSFSNALLTLLLSNQFVEIKGSVFKKFEKENLFQLTCA
ncbi:hypothetical protein P7C70_g7623, partial [Phenoliferia sp. Uapishka_3]